MKIDITKTSKVFDYEKYVAFMESKKVRHGKDRTFTLLDFATEEQKNEDLKNGIFNLAKYDPTPKEIKEHFIFVNRIFRELKSKFPNDEFLKSLDNEDMQIFKMSYRWYENYGIKKEVNEVIDF